MTPEKVEKMALFQDAGEGYGYRQNAWRELRFEHSPGLVKIDRVGSFDGQKLKKIEVIGVATAPKELLADGTSLRFTYDEKTKRLGAEVPDGVRELRLIR